MLSPAPERESMRSGSGCQAAGSCRRAVYEQVISSVPLSFPSICQCLLSFRPAEKSASTCWTFPAPPTQYKWLYGAVGGLPFDDGPRSTSERPNWFPVDGDLDC